MRGGAAASGGASPRFARATAGRPRKTHAKQHRQPSADRSRGLCVAFFFLSAAIVGNPVREAGATGLDAGLENFGLIHLWGRAWLLRAEG